ncbi:MAG: diguanylate cyclase [Deltaproteobacteria bacterium]|nr:diguanylate cyclase [Deltaproteobacteria bacterium]
MQGQIEKYDISLLYVEDEQSTREQVSGLLRRIVSTLYVASDGVEGLALYRQNMPDVVLSDIMMPRMDGLEMASQIRMIKPDCHIIVLTAYSDTEYLLECIAIGISQFAQKPVDFAKLSQTIGQCNDLIQMERRVQKQGEMIQLLSQAMEQAPAPVVIAALDGSIEYVNAMFCRVTGYEKAEVIGRNPRFLKSEINPPEVYRDLWKTITSGKEWECELANRRKNGQIYWEWVKISPVFDSAGNIIKYLKVAQDITDRKKYEESLHYLSTHDSLTGLYNRVYFDAEMKRLEASREYPVSIIVADVDGLKTVNDSEGHDAGDQLIQATASAILTVFRAADVVARIGGDEFAVLLPHTDRQTAQDAVDRIRSNIESSASELHGGGLSLGIATAQSGDELLAALKRADELMYLDKHQKRNKFPLNEKQG